MNNFKKKLKVILKRNDILLKLYEYFFQKNIINLYATKYTKKVLISYSTYHFNKTDYKGHSNYQESNEFANVFNELGYQVDVINNNKLTKLNLDKYDVIFGEGLPLYQAIDSKSSALKIYYGTGSHPFHCTMQSYSRLIEYQKTKNIIAEKSLRSNDLKWGVAASTADAVICIGNEATKQTFFDYGSKSVLTVDPTFHPRNDAQEIGLVKNFSSCRKNMLWFGSYGLLHKGLDLAVEAARANPTWTLYICGYTEEEKDLIDSLVLPRNVKLYGFIDVFSEQFKQLCLTCGFVILPSCSEGIATSVITAVANGAMIPIVTKECGFDLSGNGFLIDLDVEDIIRTISHIDSLDVDTLKSMSLVIQEATLNRYTLGKYKESISSIISGILDSEKTIS